MRMKGAETWKEGQAPQTPLQRTSFVDSCVKWLTKDITPQEAVFEVYTTYPNAVQPNAFPMVQTHEEQRSDRCAFCGDANHGLLQTLTVNPFTPRCLVTVCSKCLQGG